MRRSSLLTDVIDHFGSIYADNKFMHKHVLHALVI